MRKQSKEINITIIGIVAFVAFVAGYTTKGFLVDTTDTKKAGQLSSDESSRTITSVKTKKIEAEEIISESEGDGNASEEFTFTRTLTDDKPKKPVSIKKPVKTKTSAVSTKAVRDEKKKTAPKKNSTPPIVTGATYYAIQVGSFADNKDAESLRKKLTRKGYDAFIASVYDQRQKVEPCQGWRLSLRKSGQTRRSKPCKEGKTSCYGCELHKMKCSRSFISIC